MLYASGLLGPIFDRDKFYENLVASTMQWIMSGARTTRYHSERFGFPSGDWRLECSKTFIRKCDVVSWRPPKEGIDVYLQCKCGEIIVLEDDFNKPTGREFISVDNKVIMTYIGAFLLMKEHALRHHEAELGLEAMRRLESNYGRP